MNFATMNKQRKFIMIAALAGIIGIFLPWASFGGFISVNGFNGWGILVFFAFLGAGAIAYLGNQLQTLEKTMWFVALICGAIGLLFSVIFLARAGSFSGIGVYVSLLASAGILGSAWMFKNPGDDIKSGFDSLKKNIEDKTKQPPTTP
ncbi:MAG: hypothetical protein ABIX01_14790 [Chitinophagaceae bacterium]